jgi:hypothetical protein
MTSCVHSLFQKIQLVQRKMWYSNFKYRYNVSPIPLNEFVWCGEFYEGGPLVSNPPMKWSASAEKFEKHWLKYTG